MARHPYYSPLAAYRWIIILSRLAEVDSEFLEIGAKGSIATARMKLFMGRKFILETTAEAFDDFKAISSNVVIVTEGTARVRLKKLPAFISAWENSVSNPFIDVVIRINKLLASKSSGTISGFSFQPDAILALEEYLKKAGRRFMVTQSMVVLQ